MSAPVIAAKILVVGPLKSGKTTIANYIADFTETLVSGGNYKPTVGTRILECDREVTNSQARSWDTNNIAVELWDVSGDQQYENCWPAIMKGTDAVIMVFNPDNRAHEQEVALWYEWFVKNAGLNDSQCLCFAHRSSGQGSAARKPPRSLQRVKVINSSYESATMIKNEFDQFLNYLAGSLMSKAGADEK